MYFHLEDGPYFLVIPVHLEENEFRLYHCRAEAECGVYLAITSETLSAAEIAARVGLAPTKSWEKGTAMPRGQRDYTFSAWFFDPAGRGPGEFERKLRTLLDATETHAAAIHVLSVTGECSVCVRVPYSGYQEQMWGLPFEAHDLQRLAALGAGLDVDLYAYGPELAETD